MLAEKKCKLCAFCLAVFCSRTDWGFPFLFPALPLRCGHRAVCGMANAAIPQMSPKRSSTATTQGPPFLCQRKGTNSLRWEHACQQQSSTFYGRTYAWRESDYVLYTMFFLHKWPFLVFPDWAFSFSASLSNCDAKQWPKKGNFMCQGTLRDKYNSVFFIYLCRTCVQVWTMATGQCAVMFNSWRH